MPGLKSKDKSKRAKKKGGSESESEGGENPCEEFAPVVFPEVQPFPCEGILGMFPVYSACQKDVAEHMYKFQKRLEEEYTRPPHLTAKIVDYKNENPLAKSLDRVSQEMSLLQSEIDEMKHVLAVASIKKKYGQHESYCPCYNENK